MSSMRGVHTRCGFFEGLYEFLLIDVLENILKRRRIFFRMVFFVEIQRPFFAQRHIETAACKAFDRLIRIVHA